MNESTIDRDEQILTDELPDVALEVAAGKYGKAGNPFTIAFCSGLDTCPAWKTAAPASTREWLKINFPHWDCSGSTVALARFALKAENATIKNEKPLRS
jgi:hypothetical protein